MSLTMLAPCQSLAKIIQTDQEVTTQIAKEADINRRELCSYQKKSLKTFIITPKRKDYLLSLPKREVLNCIWASTD